MFTLNRLWESDSQPFEEHIDGIKELFDTMEVEEGTTGHLDRNESKKVRNSDVKFISPNSDNEWLFKDVTDYIAYVNDNLNWNFHINVLPQLQFTIYNEGQYYGWHPDYDCIGHPRRKISFSILLSGKNEYEGGDIEFWDLGTPERKEGEYYTARKVEAGDIILFPSYTWHRVKPVTKGTRLSLVGWVEGNEWQ